MHWLERVKEELETVSKQDIQEAEPNVSIEDDEIKLGVVPDEVKRLVVLWRKHKKRAGMAVNESEKIENTNVEQAEAYFSIACEEYDLAQCFECLAMAEIRQQLKLWGRAIAVRKDWIVVSITEKDEEDGEDFEEDDGSDLDDGFDDDFNDDGCGPMKKPDRLM